MATRWCTMEEVQADLARATGQSRRAPLLDEGCLVYGEHPPPRLTADEGESEEEHQLRYGATTVGLQQPTPDLRGITNMLRMVQNYGSGDSSQDTKTSTDEVIVISKLTPRSPKKELIQQTQSAGSASSSGLNPNARDFVPKSSTPNRTERKMGDSNVSIIDTAKRSDESETNNNIATVANENVEHKAADSMTDEQRIEREELAAMLKNRIQASARDCPQRRRERYTAIASLLRLHSAPSADTAPALRTPDYFRTQRAAPVASPDTTAQVTERPVEREDPTPDEREVRESISKVSAWLHDERPVTPPAPAPAPALPHLGPVTWRRRAGAVPPPARPPAPPARAAPADVPYVPSASARALSEQYAARAAAAPAPPPSLWERLEADLRRREGGRAAEIDERS